MKGDITKLDANFKQQSVEIVGEEKIYSLPCSEISLYGALYEKDNGYFQRMPSDIAKTVSYNVEVLSSTTAGVRARFRTNSKKFGIMVSYKYLVKMSNMPLSGSSGFALLEEREKSQSLVASFRPTWQDQTGFSGQTELDGKMRDYVLYFPLYNDYITQVKLVFDKDATVEKGKSYKFDLPIVYYGSSITQGGCSSRPDTCYQALICKWNNVDFLNLGFSGSAKAESQMIDYLASVKAKVFVCDYDHNAPTVEHLKATHYELYSAYRNKNPLTPIVFMTKPDYYERNKKDCDERRVVIKGTYLKAIEQGDKNVYFLDGKNLFGAHDRECCTTDGCHPNDLGFYRMGMRLNKILSPLLK